MLLQSVFELFTEYIKVSEVFGCFWRWSPEVGQLGWSESKRGRDKIGEEFPRRDAGTQVVTAGGELASWIFSYLHQLFAEIPPC